MRAPKRVLSRNVTSDVIRQGFEPPHATLSLTFISPVLFFALCALKVLSFIYPLPGSDMLPDRQPAGARSPARDVLMKNGFVRRRVPGRRSLQPNKVHEDERQEHKPVGRLEEEPTKSSLPKEKKPEKKKSDAGAAATATKQEDRTAATSLPDPVPAAGILPTGKVHQMLFAALVKTEDSMYSDTSRGLADNNGR